MMQIPDYPNIITDSFTADATWSSPKRTWWTAFTKFNNEIRQVVSCATEQEAVETLKSRCKNDNWYYGGIICGGHLQGMAKRQKTQAQNFSREIKNGARRKIYYEYGYYAWDYRPKG